MIITVVAMGMVQAAINQIIDMISMRDSLVAAPRTVAMRAATRALRTVVRVLIADL